MPAIAAGDAGTTAADVLVIGGGPAGLTAAIYLARFHLDVIVVDRGGSRAALIPLTRNHAGFPDGISGIDLVARMRDQAERYGARVIRGEVSTIARRNDAFAIAAPIDVTARAVLLATGVANKRPNMDQGAHDDALAHGFIRYCPVCDGYEVTDREVAVIGTGERGTKEALFLRSYTEKVTLIAPEGRHDLDDGDRQLLTSAGIPLVDGPATDIAVERDTIGITTSQGRMRFDTAYPALGSDIHSELARQLGATVGGDGCLMVDAHQRTDIAGLYAAGDVVFGLDQISHAMGEGGVAATTIRNDLADRRPQRRGASKP